MKRAAAANGAAKTCMHVNEAQEGLNSSTSTAYSGVSVSCKCVHIVQGYISRFKSLWLRTLTVAYMGLTVVRVILSNVSTAVPYNDVPLPQVWDSPD